MATDSLYRLACSNEADARLQVCVIVRLSRLPVAASRLSLGFG